MIDGIDNNDSFRNQPSFNQGGVTGAPATLFPVDALAEFSIQTQGGAEYGRNSGAIVNVAVKSGTNEFHGSALVLRNDNFDARNFFEAGRRFRNNNFTACLVVNHQGPHLLLRRLQASANSCSHAERVRVPGACCCACGEHRCRSDQR
jgi:hypothetical protein